MYFLSDNPHFWTYEDLQWLVPYVDAKVLGLGEAVHTSEGFYSAKVRIIQHLVEHCGFRAIAFESPWGKALSATRYVETGTGTINDALSGLFKVWHSKSVANLILFLRNWNNSHADDPVRFFGNDTQQPDWDLNLLLSSPLIADQKKILLRRLFEEMFGASVFFDRYYHSAEFSHLMRNGFGQNADRADDIYELLNSLVLEMDQLEYASRVSLAAFVECTVNDILAAATGQQHLRDQSSARRDKCMGELTLHLAGDDKTVLWAHNDHVQRPPRILTEECFFQGQFLKQELGDAYQAIAITAHKIGINFPWAPEMKAPAITEGSLEHELASRFPANAIFLRPKEADDLNANEHCGYYKSKDGLNISTRFDGLLYLPNSGPIEFASELTT